MDLPPAREDQPSPSRGRLVTPTFLLVTLSTLAYFLAVGTVLPVLPRYVEGPLGGGGFEVGLAVGAFSLTALLLRPLAGRLGDRRGRRLLLVSGAAVVAVSIAGYGATRALPALLLFRLLTGIGEALFFTGAASAVNDLAPDERRGEAVSYFSLALYVGLAAGPFLGEAVLGGTRYVLVWWAAAASCAVAALLGAALREPRLAGHGERSEGRLLNPAALLPGVVLATSVWGFSAFAAFVPLYSLQLGMSGSRYVFLLYSVVILVVRLFGARLPDRLGVDRMAQASQVVSVAGLLLMAAWAHPAGLYAGTAVFGLGQALAFPALMTLAVHGVSSSERGSVVGTFTAFFDLGYGVGAASLGVVAGAFGYRGAFAAAAVVAAGGLALFVAGRRARARSAGAPIRPPGTAGPPAARRGSSTPRAAPAPASACGSGRRACP